MTEKIRLEIEDATSPGLNSVENNLNDVAKSADKAEKQLNEAADATKKMGDKGGKDIKGLSLNVISFNQALEITKKLVEAAKATINALAADGSPAFVQLNESIDNTYTTLLKLADSTAIQDLTEGVAERIETKLLPVLKEVPKVLEALYRTVRIGAATTLESIGMVEEGATKAELAIGLSAKARKQEIAEKREQVNVDKKIAEIEKKIAEETQLKNIAQSNSIRQLKDLLEEETDAMREQERAGTATAKTREQSLKKIELIQRRLIEVAKNVADAEIKEVERVAQERADAHQRWLDAVKAGEAAAAEVEADRLQKLKDEANAAADRLLQAIEQAKGPKGGNLLDEARGGISKESTRAQLVKQAQDEARQKFIDDHRGMVDLQGRASGNTDRERFENQRAANRQIALAQREAGAKAFRDFNAGKTSEADVNAAQNSLIQASAQQANTRGQLDNNTLTALNSALQNQQQLTVNQQQLAQQVQQINNALRQVGNAGRNLSAQSRKVGL